MSEQTWKERIYGLFVQAGDEGLTRDECRQALNGHPSTIGGRITELVREGRITESGRFRKTSSGKLAAVMVLTDRRIEIDEKSRRGWKRVSLIRLLKGVGISGFELRRVGKLWELQVPGRPPQRSNNFADMLKELGEHVERLEIRS
jgi:hypothetical protein